MSKPKLPYASDQYKYDQAYAAGLADGEKRLARAIRRLLTTDKYFTTEPCHVEQSILDWLASRAKRRRGR